MADSTPKMPAVWRGRRRGMLLTLVGLGVAQAALALVMAFSVDAVLGGTGDASAWLALVALVTSVLLIGIARWAERIVAESLGQDYVFEQRRHLVAAALGNVGNRSLGVIVTRASNDLNAVRNWIAQGIVPLCTGLSLIVVVIGVLAVTQPLIALAIAVPIGLMALVLPRLAQLAHDRARALRRQRGKMSGHIADTARAGESVRIAGAVRRELSAVDRASARVVDAAVHRAQVTGLVRALTVTTASLCTAAVVLLALLGQIEAAAVASAMTLLGVMATPMSDLGRVVEYRQNYRAARRILAPMLAQARELTAAERAREREWRRSHGDAGAPAGTGQLRIEGVR
uniref:ABC transporter ATP-binding protein n=1 Tax=Gulosibacter sediminis TaxID=1729695 RepID=UPI0024A80411